MNQQTSFAQSEYARKKKTTRREKFLAQMEQVVPWARLVEVITPYYPAGKRGRPPVGIDRMLRLHFLAQWYALADEALEDALPGAAAVGRRRRGLSATPQAKEAAKSPNKRTWSPQPAEQRTKSSLRRAPGGKKLAATQV